jgi:hypothetical protein
MTIHTIDLLMAMMDVPTEVFAYTACLAHERVECDRSGARQPPSG